MSRGLSAEDAAKLDAYVGATLDRRTRRFPASTFERLHVVEVDIRKQIATCTDVTGETVYAGFPKMILVPGHDWWAMRVGNGNYMLVSRAR